MTDGKYLEEDEERNFVDMLVKCLNTDCLGENKLGKQVDNEEGSDKMAVHYSYSFEEEGVELDVGLNMDMEDELALDYKNSSHQISYRYMKESDEDS